MGEELVALFQTKLDDAHGNLFGRRLTDWLISDLTDSSAAAAFSESRAKALLRGTGFIDDPTLHDFARLMQTDTAVRLALFDLLESSGLGDHEEVQALLATAGAAQLPTEANSLEWLKLAVAAQAWKSGYPLHQLDPASLPGEQSVAGQLLRRAATFLRQQVQRSATERDKQLRKLAFDPHTAVSATPSLDQLNESPPIAPVPPYFRTPVPVSYPEYARDTVHIDANDTPPPQPTPPPPVSSSATITITEADLPNEQRPITMPAIQITADQISQPRSSTSQTTRPEDLNTAVRRHFNRDKEPLRPVRLRILVQEYKDGPGLYGLQVQVSSPGVKAYVAGATNRDGVFLCELPVRVHSGLTYDVDITWPRDHGAGTERKSITLNVDRQEFFLPFYYRLNK